jgi:peptidoglycan/LPS O-acetylase OafA/YrhL
LTSNPLAKLIIEPLAYSTVVLYLSLAACSNLKLGKYGDISFGIYLYHFPIIQLLIFIGVFKANVWIGFLASLVITLGTALISWHFIEKRLLKRNLISKRFRGI